MNDETAKSCRVWVSVLTAAVMLLAAGGCASTKKQAPKKAVSEKTTTLKRISAIETAESAEAVRVEIQSERLLTYTVVKKLSPRAVILYFPETGLNFDPDKAGKKDLPTSNTIGPVTAAELTEKGHTTQVVIPLKKDLRYTTIRRGTNLVVVINKSAEPVAKTTRIEVEPLTEKKKETGSDQKKNAQSAAPQPPPKPATMLRSVTWKAASKGVTVSIIADGIIKDYKSFSLDKPPRIVFDLSTIKSPHKKPMRIPVDTPWVKRVRHFCDAKKLRVVIETSKKYLASFSAQPVNQGLTIRIGEDTATAKTTPALGSQASLTKKNEPKTTPTAANSTRIKRIDLLQEDSGKSTLIIGTDRPPEYDIHKPATTRLEIRLRNTTLPAHLSHPLVTDNPKGAIARIVPRKPSGAEKTAEIAIELKKAVPYYVNKAENTLRIEFEDAAATVPASLASATGSGDISAPAHTPETPQNPAGSSNRWDPKPVYTGEKIALDFYDTDIKNVFRILGEISRENFAIDKDVSGKVTLALDKPVPWDQVLDLVLKMNSLGKRQEGNIIRIATKATLKSEDDQRAADLKAKQEAEKQADLVTEYISVNYADAEKDIKQHIEAILTKNVDGSKRGTLSVDNRNNVIILTDVPVTIQRALDIVKRLDRVTPQVIIEARIVEATTNFTRNLGIHWGTSTGIKKTDSRAGIGPQRGFDRFGGTWGYDTAVNSPSTNASDALIGLNITKIAGTPFLLDAYLRAMEEEEEGRIISRPRVLTLDNQEATISQGLEWPYPELSETGQIVIKFKKINLELKVTPHITQDLRVAMEVAIKKADVAGVKLIHGIEAPYMSTKETKTELLVNDNDTIVIGGIVKTTDTDAGSGVPWLSKIPLLGWIFKAEKKVRNKEELLVFITPKIVQLEQREIKQITKR